MSSPLEYPFWVPTQTPRWFSKGSLSNWLAIFRRPTWLCKWCNQHSLCNLHSLCTNQMFLIIPCFAPTRCIVMLLLLFLYWWLLHLQQGITKPTDGDLSTSTRVTNFVRSIGSVQYKRKWHLGLYHDILSAVNLKKIKMTAQRLSISFFFFPQYAKRRTWYFDLI